MIVFTAMDAKVSQGTQSEVNDITTEGAKSTEFLLLLVRALKGRINFFVKFRPFRAFVVDSLWFIDGLHPSLGYFALSGLNETYRNGRDGFAEVVGGFYHGGPRERRVFVICWLEP
jgi:hypothetical protein